MHWITLLRGSIQTPARFGVSRRRIASCYKAQSTSCPTIDTAELGVTDANRVVQHGREYRLQITRRSADNLQYLRSGRLLLQRLPKFIEQPRVLDRENGLGGEVLDQLDLLVGERAHL